MGELWALGRIQPLPGSSRPLLHRQLRAVLLPWVTGSVPASADPWIRGSPAGLAVPELSSLLLGGSTRWGGCDQLGHFRALGKLK